MTQSKKVTKIEPEKFKKALDGSAGIYSIIAQKLGVARQSVYDFVDRNNFKHLVQAEREKLIDQAEAQLVKKVNQGDWKAVDKVLSTLGKNRGYVERQEHEHKSENITVVFQAGEAYPDIKTADEIDDREDT